jgi:hypothetical protein
MWCLLLDCIVCQVDGPAKYPKYHELCVTRLHQLHANNTAAFLFIISPEAMELQSNPRPRQFMVFADCRAQLPFPVSLAGLKEQARKKHISTSNLNSRILCSAEWGILHHNIAFPIASWLLMEHIL